MKGCGVSEVLREGRASMEGGGIDEGRGVDEGKPG